MKKSSTAVSDANDFQVGIDTVRAAMEYQVGVRVRMSRDAFTGHWLESPEVCSGIIVGPSYEGNFVAEARFDGETLPTFLTSSSLMLHETHARWRSSHIDPKRLHIDKCDAHAKHQNAFARAVQMHEALLDLGVDLSDKVILTLDGSGTNRVAGEVVMQQREIPKKMRPYTITLEMNPNVALAQRVGLGFGDAVQFTGGDASLSTKSMLVRGGVPTLEHLVLMPNRILSEPRKKQVVWLNLDYCGGCPKSHSVDTCASFMQAVLGHLPSLEMVTITMAKRNHKDLDATFDDMFPPPYGFRLHTVFTSNPRVICKMYVRVGEVVRHVAIPGSWWESPAPEWKSRTFDGVVMRESRAGWFDVYVAHDDQVYFMNADAVGKYAVR
jgi:hypothetical protein